ncbi:MAG: signal recognition particle receptor subunit alpha, partial [Methyloceanibacter sp.]
MTGRKPTFLERLFGIGSKPEPAEPTPPAHKEPSSDVPKRRLPPQGPAKKAPRSRKRPPKEGTKGGGKPKGPPPAGPAATPGRTPLDERAPGTRKKGTPETSDDEKPAPETTKPRHKAPPPAGPAPAAPAKEAGPTAPSPARQKPKSELKPKPPAPESKRSWFAQLRHGLSRTSNALSDNLASVLTKRKLDDDTLNELEEVLIKADLGTGMADRIRATLAGGRYDKGLSADAVREVLAREIADALEKVAEPLELKRG